MNKLLVSDIIDLSNGSYILNCQNNNLKINANENVTIYLINETVSKLEINVNNNSDLNIFMFNKNVDNDLIININQDNNSKIEFNSSFINNDNYNLTINNNIRGNNNKSNISIRNISNNNLSKIVINVLIDKMTNNNIALEDLKGINNGGFVHIEPNIICLSNEVEANHLTTIGGIDRDSLNYLMSKGINEYKAKELLMNGFIYSNMDDYIKSVEVI